jgi:CubicO group peptidase (beta-lactamase class C family)
VTVVPALDLVASWPVPNAAAAVVGRDGRVLGAVGDTGRRFRLASLSKPLAAWASLIAAEEGVLDLDQPLGQPGCTVRHLLAHAGGYPFDGAEPIARPAQRRMYSNTGIEMVAAALAEAAGMPFAEYLAEAVFAPLGMSGAELRGSAAHGVWASVDDVVRFLAEAQEPALVHATSADDATSAQWPELAGIVPDVGRFDPCPWGLGFELKGAKAPHWMGRANSAPTFGHFGGAGTMMWADPHAGCALVALTDRTFDEWRDDALRRWPELSDAVLAEVAGAASA